MNVFGKFAALLIPAALWMAGCASDAQPYARPHAQQSSAPLTLGRLSERKGNLQQARRFYHAAAENPETRSIAMHRLAVLAAQDGDSGKADEFYNEARRLDPNNPGLLNDIGYFYYLGGRLAESEAALRLALRYEPTHKRALNNLGLLLGKQGRMEECYAMFRRALGEAEALANLAFIHAERNELQQAEQLYRQALDADPSLTAAAEALVQLAEYRETRQAPEQVRTAVALEPAAPAAAENSGGADAPLARATDAQPVVSQRETLEPIGLAQVGFSTPADAGLSDRPTPGAAPESGWRPRRKQ